MKVFDIMTDTVISVGQDEPVATAARLLKRHNIGSLPVTGPEGKLSGIITDRDIVTRCIAVGSDPKGVKIGEVMTHPVTTVRPDDPVQKVVSTMSKDQVRRLPVTDGDRLVGMVAICDMARREDFDMEVSEAISEISTNIRRK